MYARTESFFWSMNFAVRQQPQQSLELRWPELYPAHKLHFAAAPNWGGMLQARLLTGEPLVLIAKRFEVTLGVIEYYEKLFFNVCDRLHCRDWIAKIIRGEELDPKATTESELTEIHETRMLRWIGYHGGPMLLDAVIGAIAPKVCQRRRKLAVNRAMSYFAKPSECELFRRSIFSIWRTTIPYD